MYALYNIHTINVHLYIMITSRFLHSFEELAVCGRVFPWPTLGPSPSKGRSQKQLAALRNPLLCFYTGWYQIPFGGDTLWYVGWRSDAGVRRFGVGCVCCNPTDIFHLTNHSTPKSCFPPLHLYGRSHLPVYLPPFFSSSGFISLKKFLVKFTFTWLKMQNV